MLKKSLYFILFVFIFTLSLSYLSGCAKPPTKEVEQAEKAIAEAKQKEADLYVQDIFTKAEESLKKAKDLIGEKKYKEAKKAAEEAASLAQQAISQVEPNKAKMKAEVEQMSQDVPNAMNELKTTIAKTIKKMKPDEQKEIQGMIGKWEIEMTNIKEIIQGQKIRQAYDGLKAIKEQVLAQKEKMAAPVETKTEKK
jgi:F0F1-type ATP synthase membrane subunit b/b'